MKHNTFWKRTAAGLLALCLVCGSVPMAGMSVSILERPGITAYAETIEWDDSFAMPTTGGTYKLMNDVLLDATWEITANIKLDLNGYAITNSAATAIEIKEGGSLTLTDSAPANTKSYFILNANGTVQNIYSVESSAAGEKSFTGGYIYGEGILVNGGSFTMDGGTIIGRTSLVGNAVNIQNGAFEMNGGSVMYNGGNGVSSTGISSSVTLNGGEIRNNTGYGVSVQSAKVGSVTITENAGGGLNYNGDLELYGEPVIKDNPNDDPAYQNNLTVSSSFPFKITGALGEYAEISLRPEFSPMTDYMAVSASEDITLNNADAFTSDEDYMRVSIYNGQITLVVNSIVMPTAVTGLVYNGDPQTLITIDPATLPEDSDVRFAVTGADVTDVPMEPADAIASRDLELGYFLTALSNTAEELDKLENTTETDKQSIQEWVRLYQDAYNHLSVENDTTVNLNIAADSAKQADALNLNGLLTAVNAPTKTKNAVNGVKLCYEEAYDAVKAYNESAEWKSDIPTATNAGSYRVWVKSNDYKGMEITPNVIVTIEKATLNITVSSEGKVYDGKVLNLDDDYTVEGPDKDKLPALLADEKTQYEMKWGHYTDSNSYLDIAAFLTQMNAYNDDPSNEEVEAAYLAYLESVKEQCFDPKEIADRTANDDTDVTDNVDIFLSKDYTLWFNNVDYFVSSAEIKTDKIIINGQEEIPIPDGYVVRFTEGGITDNGNPFLKFDFVPRRQFEPTDGKSVMDPTKHHNTYITITNPNYELVNKLEDILAPITPFTTTFTPYDAAYDGEKHELVTVDPAQLPDDGTVIYYAQGNEKPAFTDETGVISGDWSTEIPTGTDADDYPIWFKLWNRDETILNNYDTIPTDNEVTTEGQVIAHITPIDPTMTAPTANDLTYTGEAQVLITAGSAEHGTMKYSLTEDGEYTTDLPTGTNAGEYVVYYRVDGDKPNYNDIPANKLTVNIQKAPISPTVTIEDWTYGEDEKDPVPNGNLGGGKESFTYYKGEEELPGKPTDVGTYTVKYTVEATDNYLGGSATAEFHITPAEFPYDKNGFTGSYDGKEHGISASTKVPDAKVYFLASEEKPTLEAFIEANKTASPTYTNVGIYKVWYCITTPNYNTVIGSETVNITKAALTVTADKQSKTEGEDDPALTYTAVGLVGEETLTGTLTRDEGEAPGTYAIKQGTLTASDNYELTFVGADLTINPKAVETQPATSAPAETTTTPVTTPATTAATTLATTAETTPATTVETTQTTTAETTTQATSAETTQASTAETTTQATSAETTTQATTAETTTQATTAETTTQATTAETTQAPVAETTLATTAETTTESAATTTTPAETTSAPAETTTTSAETTSAPAETTTTTAETTTAPAAETTTTPAETTTAPAETTSAPVEETTTAPPETTLPAVIETTAPPVGIESYEYDFKSKDAFYYSHDERTFDPGKLLEDLRRRVNYSDGTQSDWEDCDPDIITVTLRPIDLYKAPYYKGSVEAVIEQPLSNGEMYTTHITIGNIIVAMLGDTDLNGEVNATDASDLLMYAAALGAGDNPPLYSADDAEAEWVSRKVSDTNNDTELNAVDAANILMYAAVMGAEAKADWSEILGFDPIE